MAKPPSTSAIDVAEIKRRFTFHNADPRKAEELEALRQQFINLATTLAYLPESREKALALTHLETAQFFANASVVRPPAGV